MGISNVVVANGDLTAERNVCCVCVTSFGRFPTPRTRVHLLSTDEWGGGKAVEYALNNECWQFSGNPILWSVDLRKKRRDKRE